jgi:hypothetical protein
MNDGTSRRFAAVHRSRYTGPMSARLPFLLTVFSRRAVIAELSADVLELFRKDDEFLLYRGKPSSVLILTLL